MLRIKQSQLLNKLPHLGSSVMIIFLKAVPNCRQRCDSLCRPMNPIQ